MSADVSSPAQVGEHGEHPAVVLAAGGQLQLPEDLETCFSTAPGVTTSDSAPVTVIMSSDHAVETISMPLAGAGTDTRSDAAPRRS